MFRPSLNSFLVDAATIELPGCAMVAQPMVAKEALVVGAWRRTRVTVVVCMVSLWSALAIGSPQGPAASGSGETPYQIGAGDGLQLFVWKEPELTRDVVVRVDGKITVPLIGDVHAEGRTPEQLGQEISTGLKRFLAAPQVTLTVREASGSRFYVIGRVTRAGAFPLDGRKTVLQALALAGGLLEFAKAERILVIRQERGGETLLRVDYKKIEAGTDVTQNNIVLRPGDTIVVP